MAEIEEKSPERLSSKITGYIKESPVKTEPTAKRSIPTRSSDLPPTVTSTADKPNPKKRKIGEISNSNPEGEGALKGNAKLTAFFGKKEEPASAVKLKKRRTA